MRKNLREERIGLEFTTNEGYKVKIIDYASCSKVHVMFLDEHEHKMWTQWGHLKNGSLKNPFHKSVYGVAYLGVDKNEQVPKTTENGKPTREYKLWCGMLERCYDEKCRKKYPTYENCTVCQRWLCFANFLEDISKIKGYELWRNNPKQRISLNKDTYYTELGIITDCKEYSLLTTRFITKPDNTKERMERQGNPNPPKKVRCIETGQEWESITQASKDTGLSLQGISKVCTGQRKTCGKLHWEFVD